jgi:hypothetical protein
MQDVFTFDEGGVQRIVQTVRRVERQAFGVGNDQAGVGGSSHSPLVRLVKILGAADPQGYYPAAQCYYSIAQVLDTNVYGQGTLPPAPNPRYVVFGDGTQDCWFLAKPNIFAIADVIPALSVGTREEILPVRPVFISSDGAAAGAAAGIWVKDNTLTQSQALGPATYLNLLFNQFGIRGPIVGSQGAQIDIGLTFSAARASGSLPNGSSLWAFGPNGIQFQLINGGDYGQIYDVANSWFARDPAVPSTQFTDLHVPANASPNASSVLVLAGFNATINAVINTPSDQIECTVGLQDPTTNAFRAAATAHFVHDPNLPFVSGDTKQVSACDLGLLPPLTRLRPFSFNGGIATAGARIQSITGTFWAVALGINWHPPSSFGE